jgi:hypothetical protein
MTRETISEFGRTVLPHPPHSPIIDNDLAPSDFHLFCQMKDGLRGKHFTDDDAVIVAVKKWLLEADRNFYERGDAGFCSAVEKMWKNK